MEEVQQHLKPHLDFAEKVYGQAINSLWLGNAGAALATLSFIGAAWKDGTFPKVLLWPLGFFIAGTISMGLGALMSLWRLRSMILGNQTAESIWDMGMEVIQSPAERVGLSSRDWRTRMALCSGSCFVAGCIAGFVLLACR